MPDLEREQIIDIIKECCGYYLWNREECYAVFSEEDENAFEEIIDKYI